MSGNINNFSYFSHQLKNHLSIAHVKFSKHAKCHKNPLQACKVANFYKEMFARGTGVNFMVKFATSTLRSLIFTS